MYVYICSKVKVERLFPVGIEPDKIGGRRGFVGAAATLFLIKAVTASLWERTAEHVCDCVWCVEGASTEHEIIWSVIHREIIEKLEFLLHYIYFTEIATLQIHILHRKKYKLLKYKELLKNETVVPFCPLHKNSFYL